MSKRAWFGISLLAVFGLLAPPVPAQQTQRQIELSEGADYPGFDLRTEKNLSQAQCETACLKDGSCRAFTYNVKAKWCFLKSDYGQKNDFTGAVAGKVVVAGAEPDLGAPPALPFVSADLAQQASDLSNGLEVPAELSGQGLESLKALAQLELVNGNVAGAVAALTGALSIEPDSADLWIEMARAAGTIRGDSEWTTKALLASINGYEASRTAPQRAETLAQLGEALEAQENHRGAIDALQQSLDLVASRTVQARYNDMKERWGFRVVDHSVDADAASPRACVQFSEKLVKFGVDYSSFVTLNGAAPKAVEAKDQQICVEGLAHGERYKLALRRGLPSLVGEDLQATVDLDVYVKDRSPAVRFTGDSFVLPSTARRGIPLVSVNTSSANLKLFRIGDRNIAPLLAQSQFLTQMDGYSADQIQNNNGELVWQGSIDLAQDVNKDVVTSFPVDEVLPKRKPGVYVLTATAGTGATNEWDNRATQWFVVSDLGLSTYAGTDGLNVFVRSLSTAQPVTGVDLQLLAKNNEVLGSAKTDDQGRAVFSAGLMRGTAAMVPAVLTAARSGEDYVFLDMSRAGFDLSDRGVTGRPAPGAIDVYAWTERGIYRPGETVHAALLARDTAAQAIDTLPLTFVFLRPDGVEDRRMSGSGLLGGYAVDLPTLATSMRGTWTLQVFTDPKGSPIAEKRFLVDDFVPDRIEFDLASEAKEIIVGDETWVTVDGRYLYGAPAAGLALEGEIVLRHVREREAYKGYLFGLADEEASEAERLPLDELGVLDEEGKTRFDAGLSELAYTTQLTDADIVVRLKEGGGRAVERKLTLPVRADGDRIGIKPEFSGDLAENAVANFNLVMIGDDGLRKSAEDLHWKLVKIERDYQWYREGSSWRYEPVNRTRQVADGRVSVEASQGGRLSLPVQWGRYRLEVVSGAADGPASSVEFNAGWFVSASSTETPDALDVALDKPSYRVGETAKLKISSRYAGQLMVTSGAETLLSVQNVAIGETGGEVDIPVTEDFGAGAYVTATLYRPGEAQESRMPMRAIGIAWLKVDPQARDLSVSLAAPDKTLPRQPLDIDVQVAGAGIGEDAYVTVAAVDVGILNLTRYEPPAPDDWYFGQRRLGLEIRDIYGRLIDGSLGATGRLRTGGDGGSVALQGSPPKEKLVAFFSGIVKLDAEGKAKVSFDIPQFNGTARVMAVAWSKSGVGHATKDVVIRDPVVLTASLPRFLAPGDEASLRLDIANADAPAGEYQLSLATNGVIGSDAAGALRAVRLEAGGKQSLRLPLKGLRAGDGSVTLTLSGNGLAPMEQVLAVPVRPAVLPVTERRVIALSPGQSLTVDENLLADAVLEGASVALSVTRAADFDVPALLMSLDRYPYGCAEQTTSRALPLLYLSQLSKQSGLSDDAAVKTRVQDAIYRVLSYQSSSGSFGLWSPGYGDKWLDAYVSDFLTRSREQGYDVPEQALVQALNNLQNALAYDVNVKDQGSQIAYALYVLARNRKASISDLRYYADTMLRDFPTPLSRAHLGAALALYGDAQRSKTVFNAALQMTEQSALQQVSLSRADYGSLLRDGAAVLALAAESRPVPAIVPQLAALVAREWRNKRYTSTQEQAWMLLAARALLQGDDTLRVAVNGAEQSGGYAGRMTGDDLLQRPVTLTNRSADPVSAVVTTVAAPAQPLAAGGEGFAITRAYYTMEGEEVSVSEVEQNQRYVVVLSVNETNDWASRILVQDLLPAGFEIDNPNLVNSAELSNFEWIGEVQAAHTEFRNDRFVAAFDRNAGDNRDFSFAYVVRAVTPGTYDHPAASVEDMYRPQLSARTATGRMQVREAQ
ncbi:alpha-2-macroglobulin family protein [Rhizobium sp. SSA_523]|uniref:alpha-2-macroglobulin family protein n=1 Tax=Rhizobium sp. SSA_523 TaxID=2952477 RepID=UPI002090013C|nr:alpha-2-macroglobulin family protein [Rhizobium sp. SSA_523]MCO5734501.1 alpha-2-macroglobulin family protein [Rhizobium sp. SSA_523]WKC25761.1 alpha-2-macroglobulin family protein [Rhizobium sp. SSA_523]